MLWPASRIGSAVPAMRSGEAAQAGVIRFLQEVAMLVPAYQLSEVVHGGLPVESSARQGD